MKQTVCVIAVTMILYPPAVHAQSFSPRGFLSINGGYQLTSNDFEDGATKRENAEDGRFDSTYTVKAGPTFDIAGGGTLWRNLGVGVGVTRFSVSTASAFQATIPHPFFFNQARSVNAEVADLKRDELAVHVQVRGVLPVGTRMQVMLFGGPSFFKVKQDMITDYTYSEAYPYDQVTFRAATITRADASQVGFNAGGDVAFFFTRQLGVGGTFQFSGASVDLPAAFGTTRSVTVGGGQASAGLRVRF